MRIAYLTRTVDPAEGLLKRFSQRCEVDVFAAEGVGTTVGSAQPVRSAHELAVANDGRCLIFGDHRLDQLPTAFFRWRGPRIFYNADPHLLWGDHVLLARYANAVLAGQKHMAERHRRAGHPRVEWLPYGFSPELFYPVAGFPQTIDVLFIGRTNHPVWAERRVVIDLLRPHFHLVVKEVPRDRISAENARAKIVLNIATRNDINFRVFETLGTGAFLLTNNLAGSGLEELFQPGVHLVTYNVENLVATVRRYLRDDAARQTIAAAGHAEALAKHTWAHRADRLLEVAEELMTAGERAVRPVRITRGPVASWSSGGVATAD